MITVDGHAHVFRAASDRYPRAVHPMYPAELEAPVEELIETMDAHGVDRAVLVPLSPHDDYLAECLGAYPDRFTGIGVLDPAKSGDPENAGRRFSEIGIRGLRVHHLGDADTPEELDAWPILRAIQERDGIVWLYVSAEELSLLPSILERLPGLRVVLNHLGWPLPEEFEIDDLGRPAIKGPIPPPTLPIVEQLARYEGVHVMFSGEYAFSREGFPFSDLTRVVKRIHAAYGAGRMIWASDYPWINEDPGYKAQLDLVDHYLPELEPLEREAIMGQTAARLFGW